MLNWSEDGQKLETGSVFETIHARRIRRIGQDCYFDDAMDAQVSPAVLPVSVEDLTVRSDEAFLTFFQAEAEATSSCPTAVLSEDSDEGKSHVNVLADPPESNAVALNCFKHYQQRLVRTSLLLSRSGTSCPS